MSRDPDFRDLPLERAKEAMLRRVLLAERQLAETTEAMMHRLGSRGGWTTRPIYFIAIAAFWLTIAVVAFVFKTELGTDLVSLAVGLSVIQLVQAASEATYRDHDRTAALPLFERLHESRRRLTMLQDHLFHG
jgi:hypothetical protein